MNPLEIVKLGVNLAALSGIGTIVGNVVRSTSPADMTKITKVCVKVGTYAIVGVVGNMATKYTDNCVDNTMKIVKKMIKLEELENMPDQSLNVEV